MQVFDTINNVFIRLNQLQSETDDVDLSVGYGHKGLN